MDEQQLVQAVAQALQQGTDPQQIVQALVKDGLSEEDAVKLVQQVAQQMQQQGGEGEQQGGKKYTAEQAFQILQENQINPEHVMVILDVLMNTPQAELGKVIQAINGEGGQQQQQPGDQQRPERPERPEPGQGRRRQYNL